MRVGQLGHQGSPEFIKWMLTYQLIIDALERGEQLDGDAKPKHSALKQFVKEARERFSEDYVCLGGAKQLCVTEVSGPFRIDEYDGRESVIEASDQDWLSF